MTQKDFGTLDCGHFPTPTEVGTGMGRYFDADGNERTCCEDCGAARQRDEMIRTGTINLYLVRNIAGKDEVTDWTGKLRFDAGPIRVGRHNFAGRRYDTWFTGPDGRTWWGVQYGDNSQVIRCRRIASKG